MDDEFDTGRILSQHIAPLPRPCTVDAINEAWFPTMVNAFEEGTTRAIAGDPGAPQSDTVASYGAAFSESEHWLDFAEPAFNLQCKVTALNYFGAVLAKSHMDGKDWLIESLDLLEGTSTAANPGSVIERIADGLIVQAGDGAVKIKATTL
jgi:methionyl-tRNA formyltransferase